MKIAILGSCVTRDMIQFLPREFQLVLYVARTSLISLTAEVVPVEEEQILGEHAFNRRVVLWDMTKIFWEKLEEIRPDVLILDFIDERFDLWRKGNQIITRSNYLAQSGVEKDLLDGFELMLRDTPSTHALWKRSCEAAVPRIRRICNTIILHRSLWAKKYYVDGKAIPFDEKNCRLAMATNRWLNDYYDYFMTLCPDAKELRVADEFCVSNYAHKWGRDFFHYGNAYYKSLSEMVRPNLESLQRGQRKRILKDMTLGQISIEASVAKHSECRSLARWPSANYVWASLEEFLGSQTINSGIHSILLDQLILDIYVDIKINSPAYIYFHGNCPRAPSFKLPVFSGSNVLGALNVTKIVPSDPVLLMDENLELSWHAGNSFCNLQTTYRAVFSKIVSFASAPEIVFWGGSGGGFAALYFSYFFPGSTAMVWNPQVNILKYLPDPVNKYLMVAFGKTIDNDAPIPSAIEHNLSNLYRGGYNNRIIYLQNDEDWHVAEHLEPFLAALGVDVTSLTAGSFDGLIAPDVYLFLGNFSKDHEPPTNVEIHYALQECYSVHGDPARFKFANLINKHHDIYQPPSWAVEALVSHRLEYFRPDWQHYTCAPVVDFASPYCIKLSTGASVSALPDGNVDWKIEFTKDISTNIHELYSLAHVGRLLSAYDDTNNIALFDAAIAIMKSFLDFISNSVSLQLIMTNRGYSSHDHSTSIRANVIVKFLQIIAKNDFNAIENCQIVKGSICHLWNIADHLSDPENIYPSNHGIMSCITLAQVANQFKRLKYVSEHYFRQANISLIRLVESSFDRDGWTNENTVGYHSFILRLLKDYIEYSAKNHLEAGEMQVLACFLRRGEQALGYCVRQDGSIPPIGDSPLYQSGLHSINHSKLFTESGFLVIKDEFFYLTLICGSRSDNHKQADDSSLTLHYDGEDLVIDSGSYCYDSNDPYRKYMVSFRGHSGIFPETISDFSAKMYLYHRRYASIDEYSENSKWRFAKACYRLDIGSIECERRLLVDYEGGVVIVDRARADGQINTFYQSFILAPHMKIVKKSDNVVVAEGKKYGLVITQMKNTECAVANNLVDPVIAGWCSINWRELESTNQLLFSQQGSVAHFLTKIQIFKIGQLDHGSSAYNFPASDIIARIYS